MNSPLARTFEKQFRKDALNVLQEAIFASGFKIVLEHTDIVDEALSKIGLMFHERVPKEF